MRLAASTVVVALALAACAPRGSAPSPSSSGTPSSAAAGIADTGRMARVLAGLRAPIEVADRPPVRWALAERMAQHRVPGVSIAVIEGGRVAWARGFGVKQAGGADSVTDATLFQAASISKPVAATAMLRLVERGTLDLDADVNRYLTSWKVPENAHTAAAKVTLRRIASHSAGLTVHGFPGYTTTAAVPTVVQVLDGAAPANTRAVRVDTTPGAITRYSGGGTTVMQQLLVDVTGMPFPALARQLVLEPAGMTRSTYEQPLPAARAGEAARAHRRDGTPIDGGWHVYPEMAAAGLWTTPTDLARWAIAIADARAGRATTLLSRATAAQMLTDQKGGVGIGPMLGGTGSAMQFNHGGANAGFHSLLVYYPEAGVGAAIMTNGDGGPPLIREIVGAIAAEYGWPPGYAPPRVQVVALDSARVAGIAGRWRMNVAGGAIAEVRQEGGRILFDARPQLPPGAELLATSDTTFVLSPLLWRVRFSRDASGRATTIRLLRDGGPPIDGTRAP